MNSKINTALAPKNTMAAPNREKLISLQAHSIMRLIISHSEA